MKRSTVLLLILCIASVSQAVMLADFETGLDGMITTGTPVSILATSTTAEAVTSGVQCLKVTHKPTNYWPIRWVAPSVPAKLGKLQFDLTCLAADWPTQPWTRFCEKIAIQSDGPGGGWAEYTTTTANWTNRLTGEQAPVDWGAWDGDCFRTCTIDISNYDATGATYFQINFSFNCGTEGPYYVDNIHFVDEPHNPSPAAGGVGVIGVDTSLCWENATDSLNAVHVWFGVPPEPNLADPNTILSVDTYKTLLTNIYNETAPGATSCCPMPSITDGVIYTWCVESDPNTIPVPFWTFTATTNNPPNANAGPDQYIYEYADVNDIQITLDGSASSDPESPLVYVWTQLEGPAAVITDSSAETTTVTLQGGLANLTEAGSDAPYVFQLSVFDGQFTDLDTVTIFVNSDSCRASIEAGSFYFYGDIAGPAGAGDENRDCKIDLYDFAELALNWLGCTDTFENCQ